MVNIVFVIELDLVLQGKSELLFRSQFAFLRASAQCGKIQFNLSLPLRRYAPAGSWLRKERTSLSHFADSAGVSRLRTKSVSININDTSLYTSTNYQKLNF
jgi:hypothetical protein